MATTGKLRDDRCDSLLCTLGTVIIGVGFTTAALLIATSRFRNNETTSTTVPHIDVEPEWPNSVEPKLGNHRAYRKRSFAVSPTILFNHMNVSVDPCDDFYEFVCGNYRQRASNVLTDMRKKMDDYAKRYLAMLNVPARRQSPVQKAAALYRSCLNVASGKWDDSKSLRKSMRLIGISMFAQERGEPLDALFRISFKYGLKALMTVNFEDIYRLEEKRKITLFFSLDKLSRFIMSRYTTNIHSFYMTHMYAYGIKEEEEDAAEEIINNLTAIQKRVSAYEPLLQFHPNNLLFTTVEGLDTYITHIPAGRFQTLVSKHTDGIYGPADHVITSTKGIEFIDKMYSLPDDGLGLLIAWIVLLDFARFSSAQVANLYRAQQEDILPNNCFAAVRYAMEMPVLSTYLFRTVPSKAVRAFKRTYQHIHSSVLREISSSSWLEPSPKRIALAKVRALRSMIGYPEHLSSEEAMKAHYGLYPDVGRSFLTGFLLSLEQKLRWQVMNQTQFFFHLRMVNAHYITHLNIVILPATILLPPMFFLGGPPSVNYGGAGHIVGHEIMHGFDVLGSRYDASNQRRDWWTPVTWKRYVEKALCLRRSHQSSVKRRVSEELDAMLDSENMADFLGLVSSLNAFRRLKDREAVSGLPYKATQLFFISFCGHLCTAPTGGPRQGYAMDHARCNVPLRNLPEFAAAFRCPSHAPMNPPEKCSFW